MKDMKQMVEDQYKLFENILKRPLTDDERYLVRNGFQNGFGSGKTEMKEEIIAKVKKM